MNIYRVWESCPIEFEELFLVYDYNENSLFIKSKEEDDSSKVTLLAMPRRVHRVKDMDIMRRELEDAFCNLVQNITLKEAV